LAVFCLLDDGAAASESGERLRKPRNSILGLLRTFLCAQCGDLGWTSPKNPDCSSPRSLQTEKPRYERGTKDREESFVRCCTTVARPLLDVVNMFVTQAKSNIVLWNANLAPKPAE
jgi:hypothetical protein